MINITKEFEIQASKSQVVVFLFHHLSLEERLNMIDLVTVRGQYSPIVLDCSEEGKLPLSTLAETKNLVQSMLELCEAQNCFNVALFGKIPVPVKSYLAGKHTIREQSIRFKQPVPDKLFDINVFESWYNFWNITGIFRV